MPEEFLEIDKKVIMRVLLNSPEEKWERDLSNHTEDKLWCQQYREEIKIFEEEEEQDNHKFRVTLHHNF